MSSCWVITLEHLSKSFFLILRKKTLFVYAYLCIMYTYTYIYIHIYIFGSSWGFLYHFLLLVGVRMLCYISLFKWVFLFPVNNIKKNHQTRFQKESKLTQLRRGNKSPKIPGKDFPYFTMWQTGKTNDQAYRYNCRPRDLRLSASWENN